MFWKFNPSNPNHIDSLLNKEDVTLKELMDDEDILQECKAQNKNLLEFLGRPEIMEELVTLTTIEPAEDLDERLRFKYPNIACELLTCDVPSINERLAANTTLAKLYPFLESEPPLNPLLASFFSKTLGVLVARKTDQHWYSYQFTCLQVLEFLKSKEDSVSNFLKHLGTSAIMDLLLKLITQVEGPDMRQNLVNWLESHSVVPSLVALLGPEIDSDRHCNASQLLCKIITKTRENVLSSSEPNPLINILKTVESPQTVDQILQTILSSKKSESSIVGGIAVLLTLLGFSKSVGNRGDCGNENGGAPELEENREVIESTATAILPYLKDFHNLLLNPPQKAPVRTTVGTLDPPLGTTRWNVAKLLSALAATNSPAINQELAQLGTARVLLDLFFKYQWNNFLHRQVERFVAYAFNSSPVSSGDGEPPHTVLIENILVECCLIQRILEAWAENEEVTSKEGRRRGYMGHLILIANNLSKQLATDPIKAIVAEKVPQATQDAWQAFVEGPLAEVNKIYESGTKPVIASNDEDDTFRSVQFLTNATNQGYMTYQSQDDSQASIETFNMAGTEEGIYGRDIPVTGKLIRTAGHTDFENMDDRLSGMFRDLASIISPDDGDVNWEDNVQLSGFQNKSSKWPGDDDDIADGHNSDDDLDDEAEHGDAMDLGVVHMDVDAERTPFDLGSCRARPLGRGLSRLPSPPSSSSSGVLDGACDPWASSAPDAGRASAEQSDWADFTNFETNFNNSTQLSDQDNASSEGVSPFGPASALSASAPSASAESASVIVPKEEEPHIGAMTAKEGVVGSDANPPSSATRADMAPAAMATVDAVAASAVAALASVQAASRERDNQRNSEDPEDSDFVVLSGESACKREFYDPRRNWSLPGLPPFYFSALPSKLPSPVVNVWRAFGRPVSDWLGPHRSGFFPESAERRVVFSEIIAATKEEETEPSASAGASEPATVDAPAATGGGDVNTSSGTSASGCEDASGSADGGSGDGGSGDSGACE